MGPDSSGINNNTEFYVYALLNENSDPFYIGKGKGRRWRDSKRKHSATDVRKIAESLDELEAFELERFLIDEIGRVPHGPLVNRCVGGYGASGWKMSPERKAQMVAFHQGRKRSQETRDAISAGLRGKIRPREVVEKQRRALIGRKMPAHQVELLRTKLKGRPCPEGTRLALIESNKKRRGIPWSPERRERMKAIHAERGRKMVGSRLSAETRAKISAKAKGRKVSDEARLKMSISRMGKKRGPHSTETRAKMSAARRLRNIQDKRQCLLEL